MSGSRGPSSDVRVGVVVHQVMYGGSRGPSSDVRVGVVVHQVMYGWESWSIK